MNIHKNARLTPLRREEMSLAVIEGGLRARRLRPGSRPAPMAPVNRREMGLFEGPAGD
jgi:hypothetical protein